MVCMPGFKPNHGLMLYFLLFSVKSGGHNGGPDVRLNDDPDLDLKHSSVG